MARRRRKAPPPEPIELVIHAMSHDGRGVARNAEGKTVFVHGALTGERVLARLTRTRRQHDEGEAIDGTITHFVSAMGTTGTIMGTARYLKEQNPDVQIIGVQPAEGASIPGIRRWPPEYLPSIFDPSLVDREMDVSQAAAEDITRRLAAEEGIFAGISSGGAVAAALTLSQEVENAVIVAIICDRGDRYLSTGVFPVDGD